MTGVNQISTKSQQRERRNAFIFCACLVSFALAAFNSRPLFAQTSATGTIQGRVIDPSGAVVPAATVQIVQVETNVTTTVQTDASGRYFVPNLRVGTYLITASEKDFKTTRRTDIVLEVNQILEVDVPLELGSVTEKVTVSGAPPLIETANAEIGQVVNNQQTTALPLNGRSYAELAYLTPTVVPTKNGCCASSFTPNFSTAGDFSIGGARGEDNQFILDGLSATNDYVGGTFLYPSIDGIQEFKIVQNTYTADLGTRTGQVLVVSKAGTNQFHGDVYEFMRNDVLDARNTFDIQKFPLRQNQFGGTIGGPIRKDKTFWFFGYEGTRVRVGNTESGTQPDAEMRSGDFSDLLPATQLVAPIDYPGAGLKAGDPIPGNRLDLLNQENPGAINPISLNIISKVHYPLPNAPGNTFVLSPVAATDQNYYQGRIDHNLSESDRIWGSYYLEKYNLNSPPFTLIHRTITNAQSEQIGLTWNHILKPNLTNEIRAGWNYMDWNQPNTDSPTITGITQQDLGFPLNQYQPVMGQAGVEAGIPEFDMTGYGSAGGQGFGGPDLFRTVHMELGDTLNYVKGRHRMAFGIDLLRDHQDSRYTCYPRGDYQFTGQYSGDGFADFLLGLPSATIRNISFTGEQITESLDREQQYSGFAQDSWQIDPNLTVNFGLRYDYFGPPTEAHGRLAVYIPRGDQIVRLEGPGGTGGSLSPSGKSLGTQGFPVNPDCLCTKQDKDFSPRFSIAYRPFGSNRTVIRTGGGIFYSRVTYNENQSTRTNPPWTYEQIFVNGSPVQFGGTGPQFDITNGFLQGQQPQSVGGASTDVNMKDMTVQQWSFEVQEQLAPNLMASITYVGSEMYHGDDNPPLNQARPGPGPLQPRRPYPGLVSPQSDPFPVDPNLLVYHWGNFGATASYQALTALVKKQYSRGLTLLAHFTWSKSIDTSSSILNYSMQNPEDTAADRGLSTFDVPTRFVASWIYELPFGSGKHFLSAARGATNQVLGGWQVSGIFGLTAGSYITPYVSENLANTDGLTILRADRTCGGSLSNRTRQDWFDTSCFPLPAPYRFGTAGRDVIQGPGASTFDASISKNFRLAEHRALQFRGEFFSVLNHTVLGNPVLDAAAGPGTFGRIFGAGGSREVQLALKFLF